MAKVAEARGVTGPSAIELPAPVHRLRIASYNIWAKGPENCGRSQQELDMIADTIAIVSPDVCLLQEVDFNTRRSGGVNQAQYLANKMPNAGYTLISLPHWEFDGGFFGLAILSRLQVAEARWLRLPGADHEQRATLSVVTGDLSIWNVHLSHVLADQMAQITALQQLAQDDAARGLHVVMGGDFNMELNNPGTQQLSKILRRATGEAPTFPACGSNRQIDYFFTSGSVQPGPTNLVVAPQASDHCMIWIDIVLELHRDPIQPTQIEQWPQDRV